VGKPDLGDWVRVPRGEYDEFLARATKAPNLRTYQRDAGDGHLTACVGAELQADGPRWHMSISHRTNEHPPKPGRYPTWDEIKDARYRLMPQDIYVAQILPPPGEFVNLHGTTFHLWEIPAEVAS
jgi:hypothetical protein